MLIAQYVRRTIGLAGGLLLSGALLAQTPALPTYADAEPIGVAMEGWVYPYPVQRYEFESEGKLLRMAYMDVAPDIYRGLMSAPSPVAYFEFSKS